MSLLTAQLKRLQTKKGIKFKSGYLNQAAKRLMSQEVFALLRNEQNTWKLDNLNFNQRWQQIFSYMTECEVQNLLLAGNNRLNILNQIKQPIYHQLRVLVLSKNGINSIQLISQINFSKLQCLDLSINNITLVHSLCHLTVPLKQLKLFGNPISNIQKLERSAFINLNELSLQEKSKDMVIGDDLRWLLKGPSSKLNILYCASRKRFRQELIWRQLGKKYKGGRIFLK